MTNLGAVDVLQLSWQPELRDYLEACHARSRARHLWIKIAIVAGFSAVFAAVSLGVGLYLPAGLAAVVAMGVPLGTPVFLRVRARGQWRRDPSMKAPTSVVVDPRIGVVVNTPGHKVYPWRELRAMVETERVFAVGLTGKGAESLLLLAKRGLGTPEQVAYLRSMLVS